MSFLAGLFRRGGADSGKRSSADFTLLVTSDRIKIALRVIFDARGNPIIEDGRCGLVANGAHLAVRCSYGAELARSLPQAIEKYLLQQVRRKQSKLSEFKPSDVYRSLLAEDGHWELPVQRVSGGRDSPFTWCFSTKGPPETTYRCEVDLEKRTLTFRMQDK